MQVVYRADELAVIVFNAQDYSDFIDDCLRLRIATIAEADLYHDRGYVGMIPFKKPLGDVFTWAKEIPDAADVRKLLAAREDAVEDLRKVFRLNFLSLN